MLRLAHIHASKAIQFTTRTFIKAEPTSVALNFTTCDFATAFQDVMKKCVDSGYSFAHMENGEIVAQSLTVPYDKFMTANYGYTRETQPMFDLFSELEIYEPKEKCLVVFALSSEVERKGYAASLIQRTIEEAKANGFGEIIADCTNFKSQKLFEKYGFQTVVRVEYDSYKYGVLYPFKSIKDTKDVQRMVLKV
ncbi:acetyltransferase [Acanthocystis turfacea Chlorella virus MN0810.1]|nr:acetyltransferase [Acanthocystis turfacea Chlorella virus MN0810.1]